MKIISWNVNGLRAVEKKGELQKFIDTYQPDIFCIQETKAKIEQLKPIENKYSNYVQYYHEAEKPGYSGVGIWIHQSFAFLHSSKENPIKYWRGMPNFEDTEGRILRADIGDYSILSVYFPNGGKSPEAWDEKLIFYDFFLAYVNGLRDTGKKIIWCGDVNCAHEEIDLARPKENMESIGFLPEERAWVSRVIKNKWVDVFREMHPKKAMYSWWHLVTRARARNVGWRIDYFFVDEVSFSDVDSIDYLNEQMGSDHCPVRLQGSLLQNFRGQ